MTSGRSNTGGSVFSEHILGTKLTLGSVQLSPDTDQRQGFFRLILWKLRNNVERLTDDVVRFRDWKFQSEPVELIARGITSVHNKLGIPNKNWIWVIDRRISFKPKHVNSHLDWCNEQNWNYGTNRFDAILQRNFFRNCTHFRTQGWTSWGLAWMGCLGTLHNDMCFWEPNTKARVCLWKHMQWIKFWV